MTEAEEASRLSSSRPPPDPPAPPTPQPPSTRRAVILFSAGLGALLVAAIAVLSFDRPQFGPRDPQTDNAYVGGDATPLSARVQGYLKRLPIADNQPVRAGMLLAEIEDQDYRAQRDRAAAQVGAAEAVLASIDAQLRQIVEQTAQSRASEAASRADIARALPELRRQRLLLHTDLGIRRNYERAEDDQLRSDADVRIAAADVAVRERQADTLAAQRRRAEAELQARRAQLRLAEITLGWTRLVAPFDGTLGARLVREGDLLQTGSQVVVETPLDTVWVDANFTERQIPRIRPGQKARLVLDAFPHQPLAGHVTALSPTTGGALSAVPADNATGNFTKVVQRVPVRIAIDWQDSPLRGLVRPGMSVTATVFTGPGTETLSGPPA